MSILEAVQSSTRNTAPTARLRWRWSNHAEILLVSFGALLIEISYTRLISYKLFYYYVYLVIGLALLGIGTGGVLVAVSKRLRRAATDSVLFWSFMFGGASTIVAYVIVAYVRIDTLAVWRYGTFASLKSLVMLLVLCVCIFTSFVAPGVIIATLFGRRPKAVGGLYFADLTGAGIACAVVIYLINSIGAPATVMIAAVAMATGAVWVALRMQPPLVALGCAVLAFAAVGAIAPGILPSQRIDTSKAVPGATPVVYSAWGPIFRVDVRRQQAFGTNHPGEMRAEAMNLFHDGILGAAIYHWDGRRSSLSVYDFPQDPRAIPFDLLGSSPKHEAVIGAAGGHEVLASLYYGAQHIDAVELNPVTVNLVTTRFANFDGHLAQNPAVSYITGDGRSFMARSDGRFGLIWYPAPDSYAATNGALSSAYILSESYLYTTNGLVSNLGHLTKNGIFVAQFGEVADTHDLRTTRFVATARQALREIGVKDPKDHILVAMTQTHFLGTIPLSTIVVKRSSFTPAEVQRFLTSVQTVPQTAVLYAPGQAVTPNPINTVVRDSDSQLSSFYRSFPYNVTPTTDNDPYFWHFARFGTVISNVSHPLSSLDRENAVGERVLLLLLAISILVAVIFLLLPFFAIRSTWVRLPRKGPSALFFAGLGFGFIFFEITLMQELNLFLGYPTYALTVTLMSLLVFTGLGALLSQVVVNRRRAIPRLLAAVAALCLFYLLGLTPLTNALFDLPLVGRIIIAFAVLAPLGICLGMFMPIGLGEIAQRGSFPREYVAWGWAVNGFASVVGSVLATILSMSFGFDFVLLMGLAAYLVAAGAWIALTRDHRAKELGRAANVLP
ncbi:MAG: hypothetical protein ABSB99_05215 [Acidimicrobiales bacterium]